MKRIPRSRFARSVVVPLTFFAFLSGCHKWSTVDTSPGQYVNEEHPDRVRVTLQDAQYEVRSPAIQDDSIVGVRGGRQSDGSRIAIPLDEIERLETRKTNTAALAVGITLGVAALTLGVLYMTVEVCTVSC